MTVTLECRTQIYHKSLFKIVTNLFCILGTKQVTKTPTFSIWLCFGLTHVMIFYNMIYNVHFIIFCVNLTCSCCGAGGGNELSKFRRKRQNKVDSKLSVFDMNRAESLQSPAPGNIRVFRKRFFK